MLAARQCAIVLAVLLSLGGCSSHIFYPGSQKWQQTPDDFSLPYQNLSLQMDEHTQINAWLIPAQPSKGIILYFHGNSGNISRYLASLVWLNAAGYSLLMVDYRGFGQSQGKVSLKKTITDMDNVMQLFIRQYAKQNKWLMGQSLGAALAITVAGGDKTLNQAFNGYLFDSAFASFSAIGKDVFARYWFTWAWQYPLSWLMPKGYDAQNAIANLAPKPVLLLHSTDDVVVPYYHAQKLYQAAQPPKRLLSYYGAHIQGFSQDFVQRQVLDFLTESAKQKR